MRKNSVIWMAAALFCLIFPSAVLAQWAKTFTTGTDDLQGAIAPSPSSSGNYGLYGQIITDTAGKAFVARQDSSGAVQWAKTISSGGKELLVVWELKDGSFMVTGTKDFSTTSTPAKNLIWAKYTSSWAPVYQKMFGGAGDEDGTITEVSSGGFIGIGESNSYGPSSSDYDILVGKINTSGTFQWVKAINYGTDDRGVDMVELSGGGYIALADVTTLTGTAMLVFKLDASGNINWQKLFSKSGNNSASGLYILKNGDIMVMGTTQTIMGIDNILLMRLNGYGNIVWQKTYGNSEDTVAANNLIENSDGSFLLSGSVSEFSLTPPYTVTSKILFMKLFSTGNIESQKTWTDGKNDAGTVFAATDGQLLLSGSSMVISATAMDYDILYGKIDASTLTPTWVKKFAGAGNEFGVLLNTGSTYFLSGTTDSFPVEGPMKIFGLTLDSSGGYSGCSPIKSVTLQSGAASIAATDAGFAASTPILTIRSPGPAQPVDMDPPLTVSTSTLTAATLCSGGTNPPSAPTNLKANSTSASNVNLTWNASGGATSYKVYRKTPSTDWTLISTATATSCSDTLAAGNKSTVSFSYYVVACNEAGCSAATNTAVVPYTPASFTATAGTGKITLKWTDKSANETGFEIYRKPGACSASGSWTKIKTTAANAKTYTDNGLKAKTTYSYKVRSYFKSASPNAYGYSSYTACANATVK